MATTDMQRLIVALEARTKAFENALNKANGVANRRARAIESRFATMNKRVTGQFTALGGGLAKALVFAGGVRGAQVLVDSATQIQNALKVAGLEGEALTKVYDRLFISAQKNAAPLETLVTLYGRAALVQKELNVSQEEMLGFTDKVAMALRVAGTDATTASGALLQLSQALGSGVVRAEEFNSILEGALPIAQAAAAGLKEAGGSVAALRKLVIDGKVSSEAFFRAFEAGAVTLEQKVAGAEMTVSQQLVRLRNVLIDAAGDFEKGSGAAKAFGKMLSDVSDIISQTDFSKMGEEIAKYIGWVNDARIAVMGWLGAHGQAVGQSLGLDSIGEMITGGAVQRQIGPITITSDKALARRIDDAFGSAVETAGGLTERAIQEAYNRRGQVTVADKADRIPATTPRKVKPVSLSDYDAPSGGKKGGGRSKRSDWQRETEQIRERTDAILAETAAMAGVNPLVNDYGFALERTRAIHELLTAAQKAGLEVTPVLYEQIEELATAYASASVEAEKLAESQEHARETAEDMRNLGKDVLGGFINDLRAGKSGAEALANALNKVADKLIDIGLNSLFNSKGGGGGGLGGLLSFIPKLFGFADGGVAAHGRPLKRFAKGGVSRSAAIFGEAGPEAAVPLPDGRSIPVTLSSPKIPAGRGINETIHVVLQDDSGRMAQVADQRIQTASGPIIQVSVRESLKVTKSQMPGLLANAQTRSM